MPGVLQPGSEGAFTNSSRRFDSIRMKSLPESAVQRRLVVQREAWSGIHERALVDHDLSSAHRDMRIVRRFVRAGNVALGLEVERDLMCQRALDVEGDAAP